MVKELHMYHDKLLNETNITIRCDKLREFCIPDFQKDLIDLIEKNTDWYSEKEEK